MTQKNINNKELMNKWNINFKMCFLLILLSMELIYWISVIKDGNINSYFHSDVIDTFMDYFNMLWASGRNQISMYEETKVIYPAFCFLIWRILFGFIPEYGMDMGSPELRTCQFALFPFIVALLVLIIFLWELLKKGYGRNRVGSIIFALSMILSGPVLFTIERGNIILLALVFMLIFALYYNSENKWLRYLAYTALAAASAIKIYPALFGVLILSHKRWKEAAITVVLGISFFIIPFMWFGGLKTVITLFNNILYGSPAIANRGTNYNFSFTNMIKIIQIVCGVEQIETIGGLLLIPICVVFFIYLANHEEWKRMFAVVLFCIWIPQFSYTYVLIFLILPFMFFIRVEKKWSLIDGLYMMLFIIMFVPTATEIFPTLDLYGAKYPLSGSVMIGNGAIVAFSLLLVMEGVINIVEKVKKRRAK